MELTLVDYDLSRTLPSEIASAALYLALKLSDGSAWVSLTISWLRVLHIQNLYLISMPGHHDKKTFDALINLFSDF